MKKYLFLVVFFCLTGYLNAQKTIVPAKVLLKNFVDTLDYDIVLKQNPYTGKTSETSFSLDITYVDYKGKKWNLKESVVDYVEFNDIDGKKRIFVSDDYTAPLKKKETLLELQFKGLISWCTYYSIGQYGEIIALHYLIKEGKKPYKFVFEELEGEPFKSMHIRRLQNGLMKLTLDRPDLASNIRNCDTKEEIVNVLEAYNRLSAARHPVKPSCRSKLVLFSCMNMHHLRLFIIEVSLAGYITICLPFLHFFYQMD